MEVDGTDAAQNEYTPDFVFGGRRVVSEGNWAEHQEQGSVNIVEAVPVDDDDALRIELSKHGRLYGAANILLGDAFDAASDKPLRHKPGIGMYTTKVGLDHFRRLRLRDPGSSKAQVILNLGGRTIPLQEGHRVDIRGKR